MNHLAAVLTGDLIGSTQVGQAAVDGAMDVLEAISRTEAEDSGLDIRFVRFRGDGWQMYCSDAAKVFRLTVLVLANLHCRPALAQTRLAVATGTVSVLPPKGLASANGEVFSNSGRLLDGMTTQKLLFLDGKSSPPWKIALFSYLAWQSPRWSPEQAQAIAIAFRNDPPRKHTVANELGISRQAAEARLSGAGYEPLLRADEVFGKSLLESER